MTTPEKYVKESVDKAIKKDPKIKPKEAKLIHKLLKGKVNPRSANSLLQFADTSDDDHLSES
jgi:hypothetical protein